MTELLHLFSDKARHLVCWPYSVENLHQMARELGLHRCWFHAGKHPHYDIPLKARRRIARASNVVDTRTIILIIRGQEPHGVRCPDCKSTELCYAECPIAPWNMS